MASNDTPPPGVGTRYRVVRELGVGGMGSVYLAEDTQLRRQVAIKTIKESLAQDEGIRRRIVRECQLHAQIGTLHKDREQWREAIARFAEALKVDNEYATEEAREAAMEARGVPVQEQRAGVCYMVAQIAEKKLHDYPLAIKYYEMIVKRIPRNKRYYVALLAARRCREKLAAAQEAG